MFDAHLLIDTNLAPRSAYTHTEDHLRVKTIHGGIGTCVFPSQPFTHFTFQHLDNTLNHGIFRSDHLRGHPGRCSLLFRGPSMPPFTSGPVHGGG
jgi:hypothetical protein